jgi:signal transduction histidine kinase
VPPRKLSEVAEDLVGASAEQAREALFALLGKGAPAAGHLREIAADPVRRRRAAAILSASPVRALVALNNTTATAREVLAELLGAVSPGRFLRAAWQTMAAIQDDCLPCATRRGDDVARPDHGGLGSELAAALVWWLPSLQERLPPDSIDASLALATAGLAHTLLGQPEPAAQLLASALRRGDLDPKAAATVAAALGSNSLARGDHDGASLAALSLAGAGDLEGASRLMSCMLLVLAPNAASEARLAALLDQLGDALAPHCHSLRDLLMAAWRLAAEAGDRRAMRRRGHFAGHLREMAARSHELALLPSDDASLPGVTAAAQVSAGCQAIARRLGELMSDLVAYQPLVYEVVSVRPLVLEVAAVTKEELAASGIVVSCRPVAQAEPPVGPGLDPGAARVDPAMVKGCLRQMVRAIGRAIGDDAAPAAAQERPAPSLTLDASVDHGPEGEAPRAALFDLLLSSHGARARAYLETCLDEGTVRDILGRTLATATLSEPAPGCAKLQLRFPSPEGGAAKQPLQIGQAGDGQHRERQLRAELDGAAAGASMARVMLSAFWALRQAELEAWGEGLAVVLHDLKNSVAFAAGWARSEDIYDSATIRERCAENINDVQFWLAQAGAMVMRGPDAQRPWVHLPDLVRRVLRSLAAIFARRRQRLVLEVDETVPRVQAEPIWVASVLRNLAKNAVEAMPEGGELRVSVIADPGEGTVAVAFADQGPGFPPALLAGLDARTQLSDGLCRPHLGLTSVRRILLEQGGKLELCNRAGGGATATARFPTGRGDAELSSLVPAWASLGDDTRRALTAGRALARAGDYDTAAHLWRKALEMELAALCGDIDTHALVPWALELVEGKSALRSLARQTLAAAAGSAESGRAEAAGRRLLSRLLGARPRADDLSAEEVAACLTLFGAARAQGRRGAVPPLAALGSQDQLLALARLIWRATGSLEEQSLRACPTAAEADVLAAIQQARLLGQLRP